jgi:hypothetical protein
MRTLRSIALQISAFTYGFHELVPQPLVAPFAPPELELLISGLPDIDVLDLRANTEYGGKGGSLGWFFRKKIDVFWGGFGKNPRGDPWIFWDFGTLGFFGILGKFLGKEKQCSMPPSLGFFTSFVVFSTIFIATVLTLKIA